MHENGTRNPGVEKFLRGVLFLGQNELTITSTAHSAIVACSTEDFLPSSRRAGAWSVDRRSTKRVSPEKTVLVEEIETNPGVHQARAELAGSRAHPRLHLRVGTEDRADITELRRRIDTDVIPRMREALELDHLEADLLLRLHDARSTRTR